MKARNLFSKVMAAVLVLVMILGMVPMFASAEDSVVPDANGYYTTYALNSDMTLRKRATLTSDGTYTIDLEAWATGDPIYATINNGVPTDIVVVVDQSGSMAYNASGNSTNNAADRRYTKLKTALNSFMQIILANADEYDVDHRVALVGFASRPGQGASSGVSGIGVTSGSSNSSCVNTGVYKTDGTMVNYNSNNLTDAVYQAALVTVGQQDAAGEFQKNTDGTYKPSTAFSSAVTNMNFSGGTNQHLGLEMAKNILDKRTATTYTDPVTGETKQRQTVVVIFADGEIDSGYDDEAYAAAQKIKSSGTKVFSIALLNSGSTLMNRLSSNYNYTYTYNNQTNLPQPSNDNDDNVYYYLSDGVYYEVTQTGNSGNRRWVYTDANGTQQQLSQGTSVYRTRTVSHQSTGETKYYDYDANPDNLIEIFQVMSQEITAPGTDAPMDATTIMRDILASGFTFCDGWTAAKNVTVVEQAGAWNDDDTAIEWGTETTLWDENTNKVTVTATDAGKIEITGFDYCDKHIGTHAKGDGSAHDGAKLKVEITGIVATDAAVTNSAIYTNGDSLNDISSQCGIFYTEETESGSSYTYSILFGKPQTILTSESYVLDYAEPATLTSANWTSTNKYDTDMDPNSELGTLKYGSVSGNGSVYTPNTMSWNGYDSFYVLANTAIESIKALNANRNGLLWTKVNVIPANNVYYEDSFAATTEADAAAGAGIYFGDGWKVTSDSAGTNTEDVNGAVMGWVEDLADDTNYSDGSAHWATATDSSVPTATFSFTGTGVDVYSRTNSTTGTIFVQIKNNNSGKSVYQIIDCLAASGDYYQIPTISYSGDYANYTVTIKVTTAAAAEKRFDYYLDGVRIYNPLGETVTDDTVVDEYVGSESEAPSVTSVFKEVRDILLDAKTFGGVGSGAVFIDQITEEQTTDGDGVADGETAGEPTTTTVIGTYEDFGPKNEVYLAKDQAIAFAPASAGKYYVGLSSPTGESVTAQVTYNETSNYAITVNHSTDMYYPVSVVGGKIVIKNTSDAMLSVTKIQMVTEGTAGTQTSGFELLSLTEEEVISAYSAFSLRSSVPYTAEPEEDVEDTTPEETTPEDTTPEDTTPEDSTPEEAVPEEPTEPEVPEIDIEINNPKPDKNDKHDHNDKNDHNNRNDREDAKHQQMEQIKNHVNKLFNAFRNWFRK